MLYIFFIYKYVLNTIIVVMSKEIRKLLAISPKFKSRITGVTTSTYSLLKSLRNKGYDIQIIGFGTEESIPKISFFEIFQLYKKPNEADYRIFHARRHNEMIFGIILKYLFQLKLKLVFTAAKQRPYSKFSKILIKSMDHVIVTSHKTKPYIEPLFKKTNKTKNFSVITHGVDIVRFKPSQDKVSLKKKLSLDPEKNYVGCFGRIRPEKGTHLFIDSVCEILPNAFNWSALVIGRTTPEYNQFLYKLRKVIEDKNLQNRVTFIDEITNIEDYYKVLDLYVAPSLYEGYGLTPLEAMACSVPVIATDVGYYKEIISDHCGYVVESCKKDISKYINFYINNTEKLQEHSEKSRLRVKKYFNHEDEVNKILHLYRELQNYNKLN